MKVDDVASDSDAVASFHDEAHAFITALRGLHAPAWQLPTRCIPWQVRDVVGHVITVLARVPEMVNAPAPGQPDTTAISYYRADHRFSPDANADRLRTAHVRGANPDVGTLVDDLAETAQAVIASCRSEPDGRVVMTRHGDAMLLSDFLSTRVVELAVHGLDVADAVGEQPWLTSAAAEHLQQLLFGPDWRNAIATLAWTPATLLRKTTGRAPVTANESTELGRLGLRALTMG